MKKGQHTIMTYEFNGKRLTVAEWSKETGIKVMTLRERLGQLGWTIERALTEPVTNKRPRR